LGNGSPALGKKTRTWEKKKKKEKKMETIFERENYCTTHSLDGNIEGHTYYIIMK
jgi:hypothetical protein